MKLTQLLNILSHTFLILIIILNLKFIPFFTNIALGAVFPLHVILNVFVTDVPRQNNFVHITGHGILKKLFICLLIDSHKHEGHLSCSLRPILFTFFNFFLLFKSFILENILLVSQIYSIVETCSNIFRYVLRVQIILVWQKLLEVLNSAVRFEVNLLTFNFFFLLLGLYFFHLLDFLHSLLNLLDEFLEDRALFDSSFAAFLHFSEYFSYVNLLNYSVNLFINTKFLLVNIIPLFDKLLEVSVVEVMVFELHNLILFPL